MVKANDLEKKRARVENELKKACSNLEKQKQLIKSKEDELKRLNAEIISSLLVENNMTMAELTAMFDGKNKDQSTADGEVESKLEFEGE